jgi:hypothetical protein
MSDRSPKLTRRQHSVPDFYLRQWADSSGKITCHDIPAGTTFSCDPVNALVQSYFYEEDAATPDNRVEKILSAMEGVASATFRKLPGPADTAAIAADPRRAAASIPRGSRTPTWTISASLPLINICACRVLSTKRRTNFRQAR